VLTEKLYKLKEAELSTIIYLIEYF